MPINLEQLEKLSTEWKSLQPLQATLEDRLWLKLRLEWNYHSNHIEGNTLTYGETKAFLLHDKVDGPHTGREYDEMKGHDLAIKLVRELAKSPQDITETDIRGLNEIILKEPFYKEAITPSGEATRKLITPGRYKEEPNSVRTSTGEFFEYAQPMDVSVRMAKLVDAIRHSIEKDGLEFLAALAVIHHEFTLIHPFDDGNGRVARLVTNYTLLKKELTPLVIFSEKKKDYLTALRQADSGDLILLTNFLADQLIWSLEVGIKAARGENLEEPSDVEKEIELFVREQKSKKKQVLRKDAEVIRQLLSMTIKMLFEKFDEKTQKLGELFVARDLIFTSDAGTRGNTWRICLESMNADLSQMRNLPNHIGLHIQLRGYTGESFHPFDMTNSIVIALQEYEYSINSYGQQVYHAVYAEKLSEEMADKIINEFLKKFFGQIKIQAQV